MTSEQAKPTPGGRGTRKKAAKSPHAPVDPFGKYGRIAAVHGGVTDAKGRSTKEQRAAIRDAKARVRERKPVTMIGKSETGGVVGPMSDQEATHIGLLDTFGTRSDFFMIRQMFELEQMVLRASEKDDRTATAVNSGLAIVSAVAPTNEIEAALAVQIAGTHTIASEMAGRALRASSVDQMTAYANIATKFQRTFLAQLEALGRLRGKGQQTVRVEHVTVEPGGQAIVGDVHHHQHQLSAKETTDALPAGTPSGAALPGPNPIRQTLPRTGDEEWAMQDARREEHWRTEG